MTTRRLRLLVLTCAALGVLFFVFRPQAQEVDDTGEEQSQVSDAELKMYIKVYTAMQEDHDLTIDRAIAPYNITLPDFRQLERRIQNDPHLVDQVRQALLQDAKSHSGIGVPATATPTAGPTPTRRVKKHRSR